MYIHLDFGQNDYILDNLLKTSNKKNLQTTYWSEKAHQ